jgi:hypothetical protein
VRLLRQEQSVGNGRRAVPPVGNGRRAVPPQTWECLLQADQPVSNLALLLPPGFSQATVNGASITPRSGLLEGRERQVLICDMPAGEPLSLVLTKEGK